MPQRFCNFTTTFPKLFHNILTTLHQLFHNLLTTFSQLCHNFLTTFSQISHIFLILEHLKKIMLDLGIVDQICPQCPPSLLSSWSVWTWNFWSKTRCLDQGLEKKEDFKKGKKIFCCEICVVFSLRKGSSSLRLWHPTFWRCWWWGQLWELQQ